MSAKILSYYAFDDGAEMITCPECGWSGAAREASDEYYEELFDVSCPRCERMILIVSYPTPAETKEAAEDGDPRAQKEMQFVDARESFLREFDRRKLRSADQLPDLDGDRLEFLWDMSWGDEEPTVIRFGEREIWVEPTLWEGFPRFYEVKELLKQRLAAANSPGHSSRLVQATVQRARHERHACARLDERERAAASDPASRAGDQRVGTLKQPRGQAALTSHSAIARAGEPVPPTRRSGKNITQKPAWRGIRVML